MNNIQSSNTGLHVSTWEQQRVPFRWGMCSPLFGLHCPHVVCPQPTPRWFCSACLCLATGSNCICHEEFYIRPSLKQNKTQNKTTVVYFADKHIYNRLLIFLLFLLFFFFLRNTNFNIPWNEGTSEHSMSFTEIKIMLIPGGRKMARRLSWCCREFSATAKPEMVR